MPWKMLFRIINAAYRTMVQQEILSFVFTDRFYEVVEVPTSVAERLFGLAGVPVR